MWVMHPSGGFYSAVEDKADHNVLVVRARCREDLERLKRYVPRKLKIVSDEGTDYPYRVRVSRREWADVLAIFANLIEYTNFKDEVKAVQGVRRANVYSRIWGALLDLEPKRRRWSQRAIGYEPPWH